MIAVGTRAAAIAADSIFVPLDGSAPRVNYDKTCSTAGKIAALTGLAEVDGVELLPILREAIATSATTEGALVNFADRAQTQLEVGARRWLEMFGTAQFLTVVVAFRQADGSVDAQELVPVLDGHGAVTLTSQRLTVDGDLAYSTVYGVTDDALARCTSVYRLTHMYETLQRNPIPAPTSITATASSLQLAEFCQTAIEGLCDREPMLSRPVGWPAGAPLVARPVSSVHI